MYKIQKSILEKEWMNKNRRELIIEGSDYDYIRVDNEEKIE